MKILIIGDSHAEGAFGKALRDRLKNEGHTVTLAGVGATAIKTWANKTSVCHPDGTHCQDQSKLPQNVDLLIIVLGTNDGANAVAGKVDLAKAADKNIALLQKVVDKYNPTEWFWVGPPWMRDTVKHYTNAGMAAVYEGADRNGVPIFDSRPVTKPLVMGGSGDGVHLGAKGSAAWADAVVEALAQPEEEYETGSVDDSGVASDVDASMSVQTADSSPVLLVLAIAAVAYWLLRQRRIGY
jgi:lysophospholipase L1-like esterase